jgi:hypothetical protein
MPGLTTMSPTLGSVLNYEAEGRYSRDTITVLAGSGSDRTIELGAVLGQITKDTSSLEATPGGSNTGDGAPGAVTLGSKAKIGDYLLTCIETATNSGIFQVVDPDGYVLPPLIVGSAYAGDHFNVTIADGGNDFALGDTFTISVAEGSKKWVQIDFSAVDGSQDAAGVLGIKTIAVDGSDCQSWAIRREAAIDPVGLVWPSGATTAQKTKALAQLADLGIIQRGEG